MKSRNTIWPVPEPLPTKTTVVIDYEALANRLKRGPMWVEPDFPRASAYLSIERLLPKHRLSLKTFEEPCGVKHCQLTLKGPAS